MSPGVAKSLTRSGSPILLICGSPKVVAQELSHAPVEVASLTAWYSAAIK
ncbi:MAG: hypothetical protein KA132_08495 [Thauera sp.]|nr:hypothetical protein [Thauera sp.]